MTVETNRRRFMTQTLLGGVVTVFGAKAVAACDTAEKVLGGDIFGDAQIPDVEIPDVNLPSVAELLESLALDDGFLIADPRTGRLYRLDQSANTVSQLNADLTERWTFGGATEGDAALNFPVSVTPAPDGSVYILDQGNARVAQVSADGDFIRAIGGGDDGAFSSVRGAVVDPDGNVWASDPLTHAVRGFKPDGTPLRDIGLSGDENATLNGPRGMALDADGRLHVVDSGNARIQVYNLDGTHVRTYGGYGVGEDGKHVVPRSIAIAPNGLTYVADPLGGAIQVYSKEGAALARLDELSLAGNPAVPLDVSVTAGGLMQVRLYSWQPET